MFPSLSQLHCLSRQSLLVLLAVQAITFSSFWLSKQLLLILFCCPANCCQFLWMSRQSLCYLHCPCNCCQFFWMYKQSLLVLLAVQAITVSSFSCQGNCCQFLSLPRYSLLVLVAVQGICIIQLRNHVSATFKSFLIYSVTIHGLMYSFRIADSLPHSRTGLI